jgi:hypothetical protein
MVQGTQMEHGKMGHGSGFYSAETTDPVLLATVKLVTFEVRSLNKTSDGPSNVDPGPVNFLPLP